MDFHGFPIDFQSIHPPLLTFQDAFHDVSDFRPFHLPHIFHPSPGTACATNRCVLNATTVTMPVYDPLEALDVGLWPLSAHELRSKFKSREAFRQQAGEEANYTEMVARRASIGDMVDLDHVSRHLEVFA